MDTVIKTNSIHAWILAARPKTLSGAAVPVLVGLSLAFCHLREEQQLLHLYSNGVPALLCLLFALVMQIDANFINDYYDCLKGTDREDRLGPKRACAEGWISLPAMKTGIILTTVAGCLIGLPLVFFGGWQLIGVGMACVLFAFLYTTRLSYLGLGDILVLVFFGWVPVLATYFLQLAPTGTITTGNWLQAFAAATSVGLVTDNLLIVNNFRDRDQDVQSGKITLIVRMGAVWGQRLYLLLGLLAVLCCFPLAYNGHYKAMVLPALYLVPHIQTWRRMVQVWEGRELNMVLGATARNILIFGLLLSIGLLFD